MTDTDPIALPWAARIDRPNPFDPPEIFGRLRGERPLRPMTFADGHVGWLAAGYDAVRAILADRRFSVRHDLAHPPHERLTADIGAEANVPPGMFLRMDPPDHTRYRRMLIGEFTVRRMRQLESKIAETTAGCLDQMERVGPPVDLVKALALPVPTLLICELLGLPYESRAEFRGLIDRSIDPDATSEQRQHVGAAIFGFFAPLIESKREQPADDLYSSLINGTDLTDTELAVIGTVLFAAGFETTSSLLALGTFALLQHPDQIAVLRDNPDLADNAVEELLRYLTGPAGMVRTAMDDVEIEGERISAGQTVELLVGAANRDPARFENPDKLDIARTARGHVSFGHGIHQCLGQQLARVELRTVFPALFERFPTLRLDVPPDEVPLKDDSPMFGVRQLPVRW